MFFVQNNNDPDYQEMEVDESQYPITSTENTFTDQNALNMNTGPNPDDQKSMGFENISFEDEKINNIAMTSTPDDQSAVKSDEPSRNDQDPGSMSTACEQNSQLSSNFQNIS